MILARKPTVTTLLSVVFTALLIAALAAQSAPQAAADPSLSLAWAAWKAQYHKLIEQREQAGGLSTVARDRATDLAYAGTPAASCAAVQKGSAKLWQRLRPCASCC